MASYTAQDPAVASASHCRGALALGRGWPGQIWEDDVEVPPLRRRHGTSSCRLILWWIFAQCRKDVYTESRRWYEVVHESKFPATQKMLGCREDAQKKLVLYRYLCLLEDRYCTDKVFFCEISQGLGRKIINPIYFTWYWRSYNLSLNHNKEREKKSNQKHNIFAHGKIFTVKCWTKVLETSWGNPCFPEAFWYFLLFIEWKSLNLKTGADWISCS